MKKVLKTVANINVLLGGILLVFPILFLSLYIISPQVKAQFDPKKESEIIAQPIVQNRQQFKKQSVVVDPFLSNVLVNETYIKPLIFDVPERDVADIGTKIRIPNIGLDTTVYETQDPAKGLSAGVWRDPYYGAPDRLNSGPVVLAAHRWGEDNFSWEYRNQNLFTKFDQLKGGEVVIVTWNDIEYKYIIKLVEQNTYVSHSSDLIMYTCVYYNSPERIFVYAELTN